MDGCMDGWGKGAREDSNPREGSGGETGIYDVYPFSKKGPRGALF